MHVPNLILQSHENLKGKSFTTSNIPSVSFFQLYKDLMITLKEY